VQGMGRIYRSKIDTWVLAILIPAMAAAGYVAVQSFTSNPLVPWSYSALIAVIGVGLPLWLLLATYYSFEGRDLVVRSGPFKWRIPLAEITGITPTSSFLSSPAFSLDRLRIEYGRGRWIMISPRDKDGFLRELEVRRSAP
jgi:hypothetical protein